MTAESTAAPEFTVQADQNPYLAPGATRVDAVVTVTATGTGGTPADALEIIVVDVSGSMAGEKIRSARQATAAAIAELRDGVAFAVIAGNHRAQQVYPDVGTDWRVDELRTVASALLGTVDIIARPDDLAADFRALTGVAMAKNVPELWLRLWTPRGATVRFVKQVAPVVEDLTDRRVDAGRQRGAYLLGAWGAESRDYHVCADVPPAAVNARVRAARVELVRGGADGPASDGVLAQANVTAEWTDDAVRSSAIDPKVAHYTGQVALATAVADGLAARELGDVARAEERLGEAVRLAAESGHDDTAQLLAGVVDVLDVKTGTVRLRADADKAGTMALDARGTRTVQVGRRG